MVIKRYQPSPATFKSIKYRVMSFLGATVPIEFRPGRQRREFEREVLALWLANGYAVPRVYDEFTPLEGPAEIALEFIDGPTLREYLNGSEHSLEEKIDLVGTILRESRSRHQLSLREADFRLVKFDSNLSNYIVGEDGISYIDFEAGRSNEPLLKSITREVEKFATECVNILGMESIGNIAAILIKEYQSMGVTGRLMDRGFEAGVAHHGRRSAKGCRALDLAYALARAQFPHLSPAGHSMIDNYVAAAAAHFKASGRTSSRRQAMVRAVGAYLDTLILRRGLVAGKHGFRIAAENASYAYRAWRAVGQRDGV